MSYNTALGAADYRHTAGQRGKQEARLMLDMGGQNDAGDVAEKIRAFLDERHGVALPETGIFLRSAEDRERQVELAADVAHFVRALARKA